METRFLFRLCTSGQWHVRSYDPTYERKYIKTKTTLRKARHMLSGLNHGNTITSGGQQLCFTLIILKRLLITWRNFYLYSMVTNFCLDKSFVCLAYIIIFFSDDSLTDFFFHQKHHFYAMILLKNNVKVSGQCLELKKRCLGI